MVLVIVRLLRWLTPWSGLKLKTKWKLEIKTLGFSWRIWACWTSDSDSSWKSVYIVDWKRVETPILVKQVPKTSFEKVVLKRDQWVTDPLKAVKIHIIDFSVFVSKTKKYVFNDFWLFLRSVSCIGSSRLYLREACRKHFPEVSSKSTLVTPSNNS